jgi:hypothetical protein
MKNISRYPKLRERKFFRIWGPLSEEAWGPLSEEALRKEYQSFQRGDYFKKALCFKGFLGFL